jgi:hypothetical protein
MRKAMWRSYERGVFVVPIIAVAVVAACLAGCGGGGNPRSTPITPCGSDVDCKGDRICMMGMCVDSMMSGSGGSTSPTGSAGAGGSGAGGGGAAASGAAASGASAGVDRFIGTWQYTGGERVRDQCDDGSTPSTTAITGGTVTFNRGAAAMTVTIGPTACALVYDVAGDASTARPGQSCSGIVSGTDLRLTLTIVSSVYTTLDGANMTSAEVLQITIGNSTGSLSCRRTENGTLVKSSLSQQDAAAVDASPSESQQDAGVVDASPSDAASVPSVEGTYWSGIDSDGDFYTYRFFPGGQLGYTSPSGTYKGATDVWIQDRFSIRMSINNGYSIRNGTISGDQMSGNAYNMVGHTWTWTATRQGNL